MRSSCVSIRTSCSTSAKKFEFPELARQMGIQGKVYVNFVIEKNGKVSNVTIARGVDKLIDDEAIRVIKLAYHRSFRRSNAVSRFVCSTPCQSTHDYSKLNILEYSAMPGPKRSGISLPHVFRIQYATLMQSIPTFFRCAYCYSGLT